MKIFRAIFLSIISIILVYILQNKLSETPLIKSYIPESLASAPPIGVFLDPFNGFWVNAEPKNLKSKIDLNIAGLKNKVEVVLDQRLVPHIFAENDHDLYFAQGYITASHRLWQMEFLTHFAAGRLSEFVGEKTIEVDRSQRRMGLLRSAQKTLDNILKDSTSAAVLKSYSEGVNAYIKSLSQHEFPLEYKVLNYTPEEWTPLKTVLLLKYIAYDLSVSGNDDFANTLAMAKYGENVTDSLYTHHPFRVQPVIPTKSPLDFKPAKKLNQPKGYDSISRTMAKNLQETQKILDEKYKPKEEKSKGSNNWAIGAKKTETGFPILASDPHLSLKLPSIWYEIQLVSPNVNVYGVSLPGTPTVVIGFNEKIAWGITSAYTDGLDFYQIKFKDEKLDEYFHDGVWKKTVTHKEIIKVKGGKDIIEYIQYTHHGPIVLEKPAKLYPNKPNDLYNVTVPYQHAMYWIGADSTSNEILTFYKLNRASKYDDFLNAFASFSCPSLAFAYADADKNIAMYIAGRIPMRWSGQGKYILDGSSSVFEYKERIPFNQNPKVLNPEQQFVASANQLITDTTTYPYYVGYDFISPERAIRINEKLNAMTRIKYENIRELQNDVLGVHAREALPKLLNGLDTTILKDDAQKVYRILKKWNYLYQSDSQGATCFEIWFSEFRIALWQDELGYIPNYPNTDQTLRVLLKDTASRWIDDISTTNKETLKNLINNSFNKAIDKLKEKHKGSDENWFWGKHKGFHLDHLLIPNLGLSNLMTSGSSRTVNATSDSHGPSWRMVVMLGANSPRAYGIYPGGQSGNPGSLYYANMVENWRLGELEELLFLKSPKNKNQKIVTTIQMNAKQTDGLIK
ncbi:MAG: penicillin acylase family protein [Raineya sp.]|jgi:penicillin amidase|nr:penicillin acylase family protein [Raineya sp.]